MKDMQGSFAVVAIALSVLAAGCSASPAAPSSLTAAATSQSATAELVPFRGNLEGEQTVTPLQPPLVAVSGAAAGNATHLGKYSVVFPHIVNFVTRTGQGTYTFTAADGSTLTATFTGQAQGAPPVVSLEEHATITGGTGRFADATGSFVVQRTFDQATGKTEGSFEGTITVAGGSQP